MASLQANVERAIAQVAEAVLINRAHKATKYISPTFIVRASIPLHKGKFPSRPTTFVITIGKPNFLERKFVKTLQKAKEPFPVKNIIVKAPPVPRKPKKK